MDGLALAMRHPGDGRRFQIEADRFIRASGVYASFNANGTRQADLDYNARRWPHASGAHVARPRASVNPAPSRILLANLIHAFKMKPNVSTLQSIIESASKFYGIPVRDIVGRCRSETLTKVRFSVYSVCRASGYTYPEIAKALGRDHSAVVYGVQQTSAERFGPEWKSHLRFATLCDCVQQTRDPNKAMTEEIDRRIADIESQISTFQSYLDRLINTRNTIAQAK